MTNSQTDSAGQRLRSARKACGLSAADLGRLAAESAGRAKVISASAVRNQENGTNGIPLTLAEHYAKILGVTVQYIMFGPRDASAWEKLDDKEREYIDRTIDEFYIPKVGEISQKWAEPADRGDTALGVALRVPGFEARHLNAYQVGDHSLAPVYPKGSYIIVTHHSNTKIRDGAHVILDSLNGSIYLKCMREIRLKKESVELVGIGEKPAKTIDYLGSGEIHAIFVDEVVVASVLIADNQGGDPIEIPTELLTDPDPDSEE